MSPTRRATLAAIGAGVSSCVGPVASARSPGGEANSPDSAQSDGVQIEWDQRYSDDLGWRVEDAAPNGSGGVVALCNLLQGPDTSTAARLVEITPDGSSKTITTFGYPQQDATRYGYRAVEPGIDGGYVVVGVEIEVDWADSVTGFDAPIVHVSDDGEQQWSATVPGIVGTTDYPDPTSLAQVTGGYLVAATDYLNDGGTVLVRYDTDGKRQYKQSYATADGSISPLELTSADDGGAYYLGYRNVEQSPNDDEPVLAQLDADGSELWQVDTGLSGRVPLGFTATEDRYLVVGSDVGGGESTNAGWAMELSGDPPTIDWTGSVDGFGTALADAAVPPGSDEWVFSGRTAVEPAEDAADGDGDGNSGGTVTGRIVAGTDLTSPSVTRTVDGSSVFLDIVPSGDGVAYALGRAGTGADSELGVVRLSTPLDPNEISTSVTPTTVSPGDSVDLSIDSVGEYDSTLLETTWSTNGSSVGTGSTAEASYDDPGEHALTATIRTQDGRTTTVEHVVTVGEPESSNSNGSGDGSPGFGMLAAGGGLAGAAALQRLRGGGSDGQAE
ncbi:hypothetical protein [Salinarchaeum laminariae]|uniref:hypothetical protein n=1 Tax=Salinarchaeum laminariae TaxID=869888 RepID=UPI0020BDB222|nr:hypothetical protein [Salinarchaeum laminariae]